MLVKSHEITIFLLVKSHEITIFLLVKSHEITIFLLVKSHEITIFHHFSNIFPYGTPHVPGAAHVSFGAGDLCCHGDEVRMGFLALAGPKKNGEIMEKNGEIFGDVQ